VDERGGRLQGNQSHIHFVWGEGWQSVGGEVVEGINGNEGGGFLSRRLCVSFFD